MKTRSAIEICLPLALFVAACALSLATLVIAITWMTIGVISLGHRDLESFPIVGIHRKWLKGCRGACLLFYHLAWWPWYMQTPLREGADRIGQLMFTRKKAPHHESDNPSDGLQTDEREENCSTDARRGRRD